jgi:hypothetical protein
MSTYSAGLLKVGTLNATGASAQLTTNDATVTNLTVNGSINASNLNFTDLNVAGQLKVGEFDYINQNVSSGFKAKMDAVNDSWAWDASRNPEVLGASLVPYGGAAVFGMDNYYTKLPFSQYDGSLNLNFTPQVSNQWIIGDNEPYSYFKGKRRTALGTIDTNNTMDASNTLFQLASNAKLMTALLFARMTTLGVFQAGKPIPVSDYVPVLNNIKFVVPYYEDFAVSDTSSEVNTDLSGNRTAWNVKDPATGLPYRVPYVDRRPDGTPYQIQPGFAAPPIELLGVQGKYVNVYKVTRPLYFQDVLGEGVGFATGFADSLIGVAGEAGSNTTYNQNLNYGWTAAVRDTSAGYYPDASHQYLWYQNPYNYDASGVVNYNTAIKGLGLSYNASNEFTSNTNNTQGWNNPIAFYRATSNNRYPLNNTPLQHIENFFNDFSGQTYMQLFEHGTFNYNSSESWGPAIMTEAYHRKFPDSSALDYYDILDKELLMPVLGPDHSVSYYFDSSGKQPHGNLTTGDIATTWTIITNSASPLRDVSSYVVSINDSSVTGNTGAAISVALGLAGGGRPAPQYLAALQKTPIRQYFTNGSDASGTKARMYIGNSAMYSNMNDYNKLVSLLNKEGLFLDASGNLQRLIKSADIATISKPSNNKLTEQNLQFNPISKIGGTYFSGEPYGMGQTMVGPAYITGVSTDQYYNGECPGPIFYSGPTVPGLTSGYNIPGQVPFNGSQWGGIYGTYWVNFPEQNTYGSVIAMGSQLTVPQGFKHFSDNARVLYDELTLPGNLDIVPRQV